MLFFRELTVCVYLFFCYFFGFHFVSEPIQSIQLYEVFYMEYLSFVVVLFQCYQNVLLIPKYAYMYKSLLISSGSGSGSSSKEYSFVQRLVLLSPLFFSILFRSLNLFSSPFLLCFGVFVYLLFCQTNFRHIITTQSKFSIKDNRIILFFASSSSSSVCVCVCICTCLIKLLLFISLLFVIHIFISIRRI